MSIKSNEDFIVFKIDNTGNVYECKIGNDGIERTRCLTDKASPFQSERMSIAEVLRNFKHSPQGDPFSKENIKTEKEDKGDGVVEDNGINPLPVKDKEIKTKSKILKKEVNSDMKVQSVLSRIKELLAIQPPMTDEDIINTVKADIANGRVKPCETPVHTYLKYVRTKVKSGKIALA